MTSSLADQWYCAIRQNYNEQTAQLFRAECPSDLPNDPLTYKEVQAAFDRVLLSGEVRFLGGQRDYKSQIYHARDFDEDNPNKPQIDFV